MRAFPRTWHMVEQYRNNRGVQPTMWCTPHINCFQREQLQDGTSGGQTDPHPARFHLQHEATYETIWTPISHFENDQKKKKGRRFLKSSKTLLRQQPSALSALRFFTVKCFGSSFSFG